MRMGGSMRVLGIGTCAMARVLNATRTGTAITGILRWVRLMVKASIRGLMARSTTVSGPWDLSRATGSGEASITTPISASGTNRKLTAMACTPGKTETVTKASGPSA